MNYCFKFNNRLTEPKVVHFLGGTMTLEERKADQLGR